MTPLWDRGLLLLLLGWGIRAAVLNAELAAFVPRPLAAWTPELALGLAMLGALALRGSRRRVWLSLWLGLAALRSAFLGGLLADESGGGGLIWPDFGVGVLALLSLAAASLQRPPRASSSARSGAGAGSGQEDSP